MQRLGIDIQKEHNLSTKYLAGKYAVTEELASRNCVSVCISEYFWAYVITKINLKKEKRFIIVTKFALLHKLIYFSVNFRI
jgi:hypothetical protein